ncbi:MAG: hypothetical protein ACM3JG_13755, partial [Thiohalocapsa sp.]
MRLSLVFVVAAVLARLPAAASAETAAPGVFDTPLAVQRVALPTRAGGPDKNQLTCFDFKDLRVRQLDQGEVGAALLAILPLRPQEPPGPCGKAKAAGEIVIPAASWSGYFKGARNGFVLFDAADGTDGALGFAVFHGGSGRKLFADLAVGDLRAAEPAGDGIVLRYRRAIAAACSIVRDGAA